MVSNDPYEFVDRLKANGDRQKELGNTEAAKVYYEAAAQFQRGFEERLRANEEPEQFVHGFSAG